MLTLSAAVDHLRALADTTRPLTTSHSTDQQIRTALKLVLDVAERSVLDRMERDEALLAAATHHELLTRAAEVLATFPGPLEDGGDWHTHTLTRDIATALAVAPDETGRRLLDELVAARAWRDSVRAMAAACDHNNPALTQQWASVMRVADRAWQQATHPGDLQDRPT